MAANRQHSGALALLGYMYCLGRGCPDCRDKIRVHEHVRCLSACTYGLSDYLCACIHACMYVHIYSLCNC